MNGAAGDIAELRATAYALLRREPNNRDAHLRLYEVEQMLSTPAAAIAHLRAALRTSPVVASGGPPGAWRLLALTRIARWEANVPLELVIDESRIAASRLYLDGSESLAALLSHVPPHDVLFNSIAESDEAQPALRLAERVVAALGSPCINAPGAVTALSRDRVAQRFAGSALTAAPLVERIGRDELECTRLDAAAIVRPVGSQAGFGLERVESSADLRHYLARHPEPAYYLSPFVDYRGADGFFRKYRIIYVDGVPFPCHLAVSPHWMIHYYNAPMHENAWMRAEEAAFLDDLGSVFSGPRGAALREIAAAVPLDYFGIDCAIAHDGRVLLFEADAAMLVHGTDPADVFPYKRAAYQRIKNALTALIERHQGSVSGR